MKILIVDDDREDREFFCEAARNAIPEAVCTTSHNGSEAIKLLRIDKFRPDIIFLDVFMHIMDGKECLLKIKNITEVIRTPVIIYTSSLLSAEERSIYKKLGAYDFLTKPSDLKDLKVYLENLRNVPRLQPRQLDSL
jgi:CheY-like chemotaxis protein